MIRPITDTLRALRGGQMLDEASEKLAELVQAVERTGKAGTLTLTLAIKPAGRAAGTLVISDKIKLTPPKEESAETLLWATPEGNLLTEDPRQQKLELKVADAPAAPLKTVAAKE